MKHNSYKARLISFSKNFGSHAALRAGIHAAQGEYICFNYADLQDPLELILTMQIKMQEGNDIIWATRESTKVSIAEKLFSGFYAYLMKKFAFSNFPEKGFALPCLIKSGRSGK
jgi:dolichol-phosphate mannosyltransferase